MNLRSLESLQSDYSAQISDLEIEILAIETSDKANFLTTTTFLIWHFITTT